MQLKSEAKLACYLLFQENKKPAPYKVTEDLFKKETKPSRICRPGLIFHVFGLGVPRKQQAKLSRVTYLN